MNITNWDFVEHALLSVIKDNVKHAGDAIALEEMIKEAIYAVQHGK